MIKIKDINERELISFITGILKLGLDHNKQSGHLLVGPGEDDCAVMDIGASRLLVTSADMLHRLTDFPPGMTPQQIGWMSTAVTLSDIAAMGASPIGITSVLGLPPELTLEFVEALIKGMDVCARQYGTNIIGGDIDRHDELTIVGSALGLVDAEHVVLRQGAHAGDIVCVTGEVGTAGAALDALCNNKEIDHHILDKFYQPIPRITEGISLAQTGCLTSMMDISDGVALSLHDIAAASRVGFYIRYEDIPVHKAVRSMADDEDQVFNWSMYTGGDFELLFTIMPECLEKVKKAAGFTVIGTVTAKGIIIERNGKKIEVEACGYQQFGDG